MNVALLKLGEETKVYLEKDCVILQGETEEDITRAADRFVYHILEVMK